MKLMDMVTWLKTVVSLKTVASDNSYDSDAEHSEDERRQAREHLERLDDELSVLSRNQRRGEK